VCCLSVQPPLYAALAGRFAGLLTNSQPTRPHREGSAHGWRTASAKHIAMENRLYPMRELLGDLLLEQQQPRPALAEYETSLASTPNRLPDLYGAAKSANAANQPEKATAYFRNLAESSFLAPRQPTPATDHRHCAPSIFDRTFRPTTQSLAMMVHDLVLLVLRLCPADPG
jgi:hypothetical protein